MILRKSIKVKIKGSRISKTHAREGGASVFTSSLFPKATAPAKRAIQQAGKNSFPQTPFLFALLLFGLRLIFFGGWANNFDFL
jgi:hypothetical protein